MSEHLRKPLGAARPVPSWRAVIERRWPVYAGLGVLALLVLAWIDGGEEPLHPIEQPLTLPSGAEAGQ